MKKIFLATLLLASTVCGSCTVKVYNNEANAKKITKTLNLKDFDVIELSGSGSVEFSQSSDYKVQIIASEEDMKGVNASVVGNVLMLSRDNSRNGNNSIQLRMSRGGYTVRVSAPTLNAIRITGSGDFTAKTAITAKSFNAEVTGSGDVDLSKVTADNINVTVTGSGDVELNNAEADNIGINVSGSGDVDIKATCTTMADLSVYGSGDIDADINGCATVKTYVGGSGEIEADLMDCGSVDATTDGSGEVFLKGQAKSVTKTGKGVDTSELRIKK